MTAAPITAMYISSYRYSTSETEYEYLQHLLVAPVAKVSDHEREEQVDDVALVRVTHEVQVERRVLFSALTVSKGPPALHGSEHSP